MGSMPFVFAVCHFGENVSTALGKLHEVIYNMMWLACPIELQQYLVPMLIYAEKPFYFDGVLLDSSHETFKKVIICVTVAKICSLNGDKSVMDEVFF